MNVNKFLERTSVRNFTDEKMTDNEIKIITDVINNAPTSTNTQQFSAIILLDQELKQFVSTNNWGQKHIAESAAFIVFVADRTKVNYITNLKNVKPTDDMVHHEFMRSVVDATIAATYAHDALIHMDFGVTFVGGILAFGNELAKQLNLPETAFPVVGLSIGRPSKVNPVKPKMNKVFINKYNKDESINEAIRYNDETVQYFANIKSPDFFTSIANMTDATSAYASAFDRGGKFVDEKYKEFK